MSHYKTWLSRLIIKRPRYISDGNFMLILSMLVGLAAGFLALFLKTTVFFLHNLFLYDIDFKQHNLLFFILPVIGIALTVFFKFVILKDSIKHNVSSILHAIGKRNSLMKFHKIFSSVTGAILTSGFGGSVGLESPIISSGSAFGSNLGRWLRLNYKEITVLLACGSAGAISAIFNTPIAGIVFAIEVLLIDLNRFSLVPLLVASISGTIVTHLLYNENIMFSAITVDSFNASYIPYYLIFAIVVAIGSIYFTKVFHSIETWFEEIINPIKRILIGGTLLGILLYFFPGLYGEGYLGLMQIFDGNYNAIFELSPFGDILETNTWLFIVFILLLALLKVFATAFTIGAGGIGGIFAPSVFTGGLLGFVFALSINLIYGEPVLSIPNFVLVGMAGCLTGVLHAPLTGIFLITEITHSYNLIVPLMIVTTFTYIVVKAFMPYSIFTKQLSERGDLITHNKDKAVMAFMNLKKVIETDLLRVPVGANLGELVNIIANSKRNIFPVVDDNNILMGIIYVENIRSVMFKSEHYNNLMVRELMSKPKAVIHIDDNMNKVIDTFNKTDAWNLPVVNDGVYMGFVSKSKLFSEYRNQLIEITDE